MAARDLREDEKWTRPRFRRDLGATVRFRVVCEAKNGRCVAGATRLVGHRTHERMFNAGRRV